MQYKCMVRRGVSCKAARPLAALPPQWPAPLLQSGPAADPGAPTHPHAAEPRLQLATVDTTKDMRQRSNCTVQSSQRLQGCGVCGAAAAAVYLPLAGGAPGRRAWVAALRGARAAGPPPHLPCGGVASVKCAHGGDAHQQTCHEQTASSCNNRQVSRDMSSEHSLLPPETAGPPCCCGAGCLLWR
jgi:hypothetical protein